VDWRLEHLETQPYLRDAAFVRKPYRAPRADWDHDHCDACWAKLSEVEVPGEVTQNEGFATTVVYSKGADSERVCVEWVCVECFALFRNEMGWVEGHPGDER
jgi:hypothetical protein